MILRNFMSLQAFTVYMENSLRFEICTKVSFTTPELMWTLTKLPHTDVKFYSEMKSQSSFSSLWFSCKRALKLREIRLLMRNLVIILPLKSKLSGKFQRFNVIDWSIEMLKNSWISQKFQLKWKLKYRSTRPKQRAPLTKSSHLSPSPTPPDKILLCLWDKNFLN